MRLQIATGLLFVVAGLLTLLTVPMEAVRINKAPPCGCGGDG